VITPAPLLNCDKIARLPERARDIVEYWKSGLSLNHIQACSLGCAYCIRHSGHAEARYYRDAREQLIEADFNVLSVDCTKQLAEQFAALASTHLMALRMPSGVT
jgi:DNA repair photolyase